MSASDLTFGSGSGNDLDAVTDSSSDAALEAMFESILAAPLLSSEEQKTKMTREVTLIESPGSVRSLSKMDGGEGSKWPRSPELMSPVTPASSESSYTVSSSGTREERRSATSVGDEETCLICGDRASGYHYNALSCEGCKGFFRRSITRNAVYQCKNGGNCEMDMWMRRRCQACRLRRCREVGMKEECLLSEDQCKAREVRRKSRTAAQAARRNLPSSGDADVTDDAAMQTVDNLASPLPVMNANPLESVSEETREIIRKLVYYQDLYELPSAEDIERVSKVKISDVGRPKEMSEAVYQHMAEMTILVTQLVVEFAKKLPGFQDLAREDQIIVLKASSCEVMMLRTARRYDATTDTVVFASGTPFTRDSLRMAGLKSYADCMFEFCHSLSTMGVDNAEYALLMALCIFSDRPGLVSPRQVEEMQSTYVNILMEYLQARRPRGTTYLAKLLMKLTELRQLSVEHSDMLFALKVEKGSLPPLLCEYFDIID